MTRFQFLEGKASPLYLGELSQGEQRTTGSNVGTVESPFEDEQAFAIQQKHYLHHFMMAESLSESQSHWTHWETCWLLSKLERGKMDEICITNQYTPFGRLTYIFNKELFTSQLVSKWYCPKCESWRGLSKSSLFRQALCQKEKWGLGRCLDLPKVTLLQRHSFHWPGLNYSTPFPRNVAPLFGTEANLREQCGVLPSQSFLHSKPQLVSVQRQYK